MGSSAGSRVFRHTRDLSGIVGFETVPSPRLKNLGLNTAANDYLWVHGYQEGTIHLIQQIYEMSTSVTYFSEKLAASGGISIAEAEYIYDLIRGRPGHM